MKDSPEDRLLHLIKGKYKKKNDNEKQEVLKNSLTISNFLKKIFLKSKFLNHTSIKQITKILVIILIISFGYLIYAFLFESQKYSISIIGQQEILQPTDYIASQQEMIPSKVSDYSVYSASIKNRELFSEPSPQESEEPRVPDVDISKKFNLVGIIAGEKPQAIIEDKELQKTYYLYEGQSFNGASVEEIGSGKVVIDYSGKKIELVL